MRLLLGPSGRARPSRVLAAVLLFLALPHGLACKGSTRASKAPTDLGEDHDVVRAETLLQVERTDRSTLEVRAEWTWAEGAGPSPVVLIPPGGGNVSRRGTRAGDGARSYPHPVDVTRELASVLAKEGFASLAWDKRTCGPRDTPLCAAYPTDDLDKLGPRALIADLEAACEAALSDERSDGRVILWGHGQAAQVALASQCAARADAIVLVAPIPRRVDKVLVASLWARAEAAHDAASKSGTEESKARALDLKNRTASFDELFKAIERGQFPEEARVLGATLHFWKAWIALTAEIPGETPKPAVPWIVVLGGRDTQYGPTDHARIRTLGAAEGAHFLEVPGVDHHLLVGGELDPSRVMPIVEALHDVLAADSAAKS